MKKVPAVGFGLAVAVGSIANGGHAVANRENIASCERWGDVSPEARDVARRGALQMARHLYDRRYDIYGLHRRLAADWYGVQASVVELVNASFSAGLAEPEFTNGLEAQASAGTVEMFLVTAASKAADVAPCQIVEMVPNSGMDTAQEAEVKLYRLLSALTR